MLPLTPTELESLAVQVLLHASRVMKKSPGWLLIFAYWDCREVADQLHRAGCRDLEDSLDLFRDIGSRVMAELRKSRRAHRYNEEQSRRAA